MEVSRLYKYANRERGSPAVPNEIKQQQEAISNAFEVVRDSITDLRTHGDEAYQVVDMIRKGLFD
jgi:hypothetical protein